MTLPTTKIDELVSLQRGEIDRRICCDPATFELEMAERSIAAVPLKLMAERGVPLGKLPEPRDYTGAYLLLASAENSSTATGGVIICDGGTGVRGFVDATVGRNL